MTQNRTYIYYNERTDNITQTQITENRIYHYDTSPNTELTGIRLSVNNATEVTLY